MTDLYSIYADLKSFAPAFLTIATKGEGDTGEGLEKLELNQAQLYIHRRLEDQLKATGKVRALILKGRQQGCSTYVQARYFHKIITTLGKKAFILAHEADATDNLFKMTRRYYDNLPPGLCPVPNKLNTSEMEFSQFNSEYRVGTAGNKKTGRSQTIHLFHGCLSGDSLIVLADGSTKSMAEIMPGDMVLTSSGAIAPVSKKIHTGKKATYTLDCWLSGEPIHLTADHKVLTLSGYKEIKDIGLNDFIAMPKIQLTNEFTNCLFRVINKERPQGGGSKYIEQFDFTLNYDFGYLIGYYLAEGHIKSNLGYISFAYHKDETYIHNAIKGTFGLETSIQHKIDIGTNRKRTILNGKFLASAIHDICGRVAYKNIPDWFFKTNIDFLSGVFQGYLDGDGSKTQLDKISAPSIHEKISRQVQRICWALYGACSVRRKSRMRYDKPTKDIFLFCMSGDALRRYRKENTTNRVEKSIIKDGTVYSKVKSITPRMLEEVWDIEVDHPDHNYQTTSGIVSNSEVGFWENTSSLATGALQAVSGAPGTEIILESTANGLGNFFHQAWCDAIKGDSEYQAIFVPWYWQDEYKSYIPNFICTPEEQELYDMYNKNGLTKEHLCWRRVKMRELDKDPDRALDMFKQEYPFTSDEAFLNPIANTFIKAKYVQKARLNRVEVAKDISLIIGVDPAGDKDGADRTAIIRRRGRIAYGLETYRGRNTMEIAGILTRIIKQEAPSKVYIDSIGIGKGVIDRLQEMGFSCVEGINVANSAHDKDQYYNRRAELWDACRQWLVQDMAVQIPDSDELQSDLCSVGYTHNSNGQLLIESKKDLRKRGMLSSDTADALMHSFCAGNNVNLSQFVDTRIQPRKGFFV